MVAAILIPILALAIFGLVNWVVPTEERARMLGMLLAGYFLRLLLFLFVMRSVAFFSHGQAGGDSQHYETLGSMIAIIWRSVGIHFVTVSEFQEVGSVALLCNLLGLLEYLGGEPAPLAGVALNSFVACWTVLILYRFVIDEGTDRRFATTIALLLLFGPSFLYHTSDTYKDGLNAFLVVASLLGSIRLSRRFEWWRLGTLALSLLCLWFIRSYMVFMCLAPLVLGVLGGSRTSGFRRVAAFAFIVLLVVAAAYSGALGNVFGAAETTFEQATSANSLHYNARTRESSAVVTDSYVVRLIYTVFAPFPWQTGSFGLQLGKLEAFIFYFFIYRAYRGRQLLATTSRENTIMLLMFIVPATLAYAATMSNIGLIVRQRMPIVFCVAILAALTARADATRLTADATRPDPPTSPVAGRRRQRREGLATSPPLS